MQIIFTVGFTTCCTSLSRISFSLGLIPALSNIRSNIAWISLCVRLFFGYTYFPPGDPCPTSDMQSWPEIIVNITIRLWKHSNIGTLALNVLCRVVFCADFFAPWNTPFSIQNKSRGRWNHIVLKSANVGILFSRLPVKSGWPSLGNSNVCWLRTFVTTSELQFLLVLKWFCGNKYCNLLNIDLISQSIFQIWLKHWSR